MSEQFLWWRTGIIYQVYPRSFQDSNNDGVGDLKGIASRLSYLQELGITAIWLSPIYPSPMKDFGYDISDYTNIHPLFGNMNDFTALLQEVHARSMKLILDLVPNHTSNQHPWFIESSASKTNPKRDWYIWHDGKEDGSAPNNWLATFGGTAWQRDENTKQYYYHAFLPEQPDLNWRNPEVQQAMCNVMRFWLDKGVDGFRVDVLWHLIKDAQLKDEPANPNYQPQMATYDQLLHIYSTDQPEVQDIVKELRSVLDEYNERMMIGEIYLPVHKLVAYYGTHNDGANLPFNFLLLSLPWQANTIAAAIDEYEGALPQNGQPNWVLGNHDQPRIASRVGLQQARIAAMLLLTLRGTPTIYYGDEIGMSDVAIPFDEVVDPQGLNMPGKHLSRDPARTPMQWNSSMNAGFSEGKPWLRLHKTYQRQNVEVESSNPYSILSLYKKLIALRQKEPAFHSGSSTPVYSDTQLLAYKREAGGADSFLIVLNLTHRPAYFTPANFVFSGEVVVASSPELEGSVFQNTLSLEGDEGVVVRLK